MPKQYVLKNSLSTPQKIDRILKTIKTNAEGDRGEAKQLLKEVKDALGELTSRIQQVEGAESVDAFAKLVQSAATALNMMGNANEKLLKLVAILQKFGESNSKKDGTDAIMGGSQFALLSQLAGKKGIKDDEED